MWRGEQRKKKKKTSIVNMALVLSVFSSSLPASPSCCALSRPPGGESSSLPLASPLLGEPGRSHRLRKGSLGGDSRRGSRRARV